MSRLKDVELLLNLIQKKDNIPGKVIGNLDLYENDLEEKGYVKIKIDLGTYCWVHHDRLQDIL